MDNMPRPRPPHLHHERTRHGKFVWVVRIGKGPRTRLRAAYGTPEFDLEYNAALNGARPSNATTPSKASLQWLWDSYRETGAWTALALSTRRQRENIMLHVLKESATKPYAAIRAEHIQAWTDRRSNTPSASRNFLDTMKGLFRWAKNANTSRSTRQPAILSRRNGKKARASQRGRGNTLSNIKRNIHSAPASACGLMSSCTPDRAAVMP